MPANPAVDKLSFDIEKIQRMLPHRYPFLLIDRVLELSEGDSITALKNVSCNEPHFQGHFPKYKIMPGVLIVEAMAQAGGILLYHSLPDPASKLVFLSKINNTRFRRPVVPGDQLVLETTTLRTGSRVWKMAGKAFVGDKLAAEAEFMATIQ